MKKKNLILVTTAVLLASTATFTIYVFFPALIGVNVVNTENITVLEQTSVLETNYKNIEEGLNISTPYSGIVGFEMANRSVPEKWEGKEISFRYSYLGEYSSQVFEELNTLLETDYNWKNQLDENENVLLGGPMFLKDGVYQLHVHNGLSLAQKYYLFGDLLDYLNSKDLLEGTRIKLGNVKLECNWVEEIYVEEDNVVEGGVELIISTCLERNGDWRLVSGWEVMED
jgi:hypothetical protein